MAGLNVEYLSDSKLSPFQVAYACHPSILLSTLHDAYTAIPQGNKTQDIESALFPFSYLPVS
jgi:hypothetical protein